MARTTTRARVIPSSADVRAEVRLRAGRPDARECDLDVTTAASSAPHGSCTSESATSSTAPGQRRRAAGRSHRLFTLRLIREGSFPAPEGYPERDIQIGSPRDVFQRMAPYAAREVGESFWVLLLNSQHHLIGGGPTVITRGVLNASLVHPREVFCAAIMSHAAAIVLCHNHPSGDPTPSAEDRAVTEQLVASGRLLDIPVEDHVIVGRGRYVSFVEAGLL